MTHHEAADTGGGIALFIGIGTWILEKLADFNFSDFLTGVSLFLGIVWMVFKIIGQRTENKIKRKQLDDLEETTRNN